MNYKKQFPSGSCFFCRKKVTDPAEYKSKDNQHNTGYKVTINRQNTRADKELCRIYKTFTNRQYTINTRLLI